LRGGERGGRGGAGVWKGRGEKEKGGRGDGLDWGRGGGGKRRGRGGGEEGRGGEGRGVV